ncbi:MAG: hypothetical protein K2P88_17385 [Chitinophagaceae bacterium]|uniref:hypothetical protein n=1 Tax=unclassified Paraflavitalea TaxID=2798305 RepID=UPI003D3458D0|nr:hypothetical protein [Chitinophagaceae bacterium]
MKTFLNRLMFLTAITMGGVVGLFKGNEAKQKWAFRVRSRFNEKQQMAEQKKMKKEGGVVLDDIELAAFHRV